MVDIMWHYLKDLRADRRGNFAIEFALALPVLLLLLVALLDLGRLSIEKSALLQGAREGAQYGILAQGQAQFGTMASADQTVIQTTAQNSSGVAGATASASVRCECVAGTEVSPCPASCSGGGPPKQYVVVSITAPFHSVLTSATTTFGGNGWIGGWSPPASVSAEITMIVP